MALSPALREKVEKALEMDRMTHNLTADQRTKYGQLLDADRRGMSRPGQKFASGPAKPMCQGIAEVGGACKYRAREGSRYCGNHRLLDERG